MAFDEMMAAMGRLLKCDVDTFEPGKRAMLQSTLPVVVTLQEEIGVPGHPSLQWYRTEVILGGLDGSAGLETYLGLNYDWEAKLALRQMQGTPVMVALDRYALPTTVPDERVASILVTRSAGFLGGIVEVPGVVPLDYE
jgi:hypothetical protein